MSRTERGRRTTRTTIGIDEPLLREAMALTGLATPAAVIEDAGRRLIGRHRQRQAIATVAGLGWEGDLDAMRRERSDAPG
ncbi:type II toxin-antitoxin system VapB family antitoxin [Labrys wisconsinensis]|nr:type II toxin-antitoxin system VapB family antitoxin [Labrys wisconsinensis]